ncbi:MAG: DHH family phosphoesterase [Candidatus Micrarchaeota archaeon]
MEISISKTTDMKGLLDNRNVIVVTHLKDIDGIASAAIAMNVFGERLSGVVFSDFEFDAIEKANQILKELSPENSVVIFADLNFNDNAIKLYEETFKMLKAKGNKIIWLDHHTIASNNVKELIEKYADYIIAGENKNYCGAELVAEYIAKLLGKYDDKVAQLAKMAHTSDFALHDKDDEKRKKLSYAIASCYLYAKDFQEVQACLLKIAEAVAKDPNNYDNDEFIKERATFYEEKQRSLKEELGKNVHVINLNGHTIVIGFNFSGSLQTNDGCNHLFSLAAASGKKADMALYIKVDRGTGHIRVADDSNINSVPLAQIFDGNGHPPASAFPIPKDLLNELRDPDPKKKEAAKQNFIKRIEEKWKPLLAKKDKTVVNS